MVKITAFTTAADAIFHMYSMDKNSMEKLREASAAEAQVASDIWQAAQVSSAAPAEETSVSDVSSQAADTTSDGSDNETDVRLHPRAVCNCIKPFNRCSLTL